MRRLLAAIGVALSVAACGGGSTTKTTTSAASRKAAAPAALPSGSRLVLDTVQPLAWAYAADGSLYYAYANPVGEHVGEAYELTRVDTATRRVVAVQRFGSALDATVAAGGSLWVTTTVGETAWLWRLDPASLKVESDQKLPSSRSTEGIAGSLAVAGGHLWIGNGVLDRVSLQTGRVDRVVSPSHPGPVQVAADPGGRVLLASLGYEHPTYVARLNPDTGAPLSELTVPESDTQPSLGGVLDGGAWVENTVGYRTSAWRIALGTFKVTRADVVNTGASRLSIRTIDGVLWVTEPLGQDNLNYCADPVTGRPLARLPLLPGDSVLLTADETSLFYTDVPVNAHAVKLETAPINRDCVS
ncbi:MAG TPA: hypothetical protein VIH85_27995 [Solirubrobacteraceae bacterium]